MKTYNLIIIFTLLPFFGFSQLHLTNGLKISNANEATGKVLTSDAVGNATWQSPVSYWQINGLGGNELRNTNNGGFWSPYPTPLSYTANNTTNPPIAPTTGNGTRMTWIPARSAFQAGTFNTADGSVRFISDNIGLFSFCGGLNAEARSRGGVALGIDAIADGTSNTVAFGENVRANGTNCVVFGQNSYANANNSLVGGFNSNITDGVSNTFLFGESSSANTNSGFGFGRGLRINTFSCTTLGSFNLLPFIESSTTNWIPTQPLFMIGNGTDDLSRSNAMMILKNGKTAIGNIAPESFLHVFESESGAVSGINNVATFERNTHAYIGILTPEANESGIAFGLPSNGHSGGIYYNSSNDKRMTFRTNGNSTKMTLLANGNLGIGALNPVNPLHIHNATGAEAFMRFTNVNSGQTTSDGIEVGYQSDGTGKFFVRENKGLILGTNNATRINILATGEVGIGATPTAKLDVAGTTKLGTNGTILNEIIKVTVNGDISSITSLDEGSLSLPVTNAAVNSTVYVSPNGGLPAGLILSYAYVSAANVVTIKFYNATGNTINPAARDFHITVIR